MTSYPFLKKKNNLASGETYVIGEKEKLQIECLGGLLLSLKSVTL